MIVDLRSDTFTKPSPEMREVIAEAEVGDDVFGEDPTVNRLQDEMADMMGKEAGLFVASGTLGNQASIHAHTMPGQEVILDKEAHIFYYEAGAPALLSGVQLRPLPGPDGILTVEQVASAVRPDNVHFPPTALVCLENTLNRAGGRVFPIENMKKIWDTTRKHGVKLHLDGARLWNASVATGISLKEYASCCDSVTVCFSKGLGAPVGSLIVGGAGFIRRAHRCRKICGGGMRQAGILAAAALYAVAHNFPKLKRDHENARRPAEAVAGLPGLSVDLDSVQTNIVMIYVNGAMLTAQEIAGRLQEKGILVLALGPAMLRAVTHLDVSDEGIDRAIDAFRDAMDPS